MITRGFIENLANRTVGKHLTILFRPAISPDMIPDAFSSAESFAPTLPSPMTESAEHPSPAAYLPTQHPGKKVSVTPDVKPQKNPSFDARENNNDDGAVPTVRMGGKPHISPDAPAATQAETYPQKPLSEKGGRKETTMQDEKKPLIRPDGTHENQEPDRLTVDNSKEIPEQGKDDNDTVVVVPTTSVAVKTKGSAQQPRIEAAKDAAVATTLIRPDAGHMVKEKDYGLTTPYVKPNRPEFIQQGVAGAHPATQAQDQAKHDQDTVTINIGRIEVRAVFPQKHGSPAKEQTGVSLSQYLKLRSEGKI